jgi:TPR repeat protein
MMTKRAKLVIAGILLVLAPALSAWADFAQGLRAYEQHDFATALKTFKADGGADSAYLLGIMYYKGEGVKPDKEEAVKWVHKAAEKGHVRAAYNLGMIYDKGDGVPKDLKEAARWYRKAADKGHAQSQFNLGLMYTNGEGVQKDKKEAIKWLRKAAKQGNANARKLLNIMEEK